MAKEKIEIIVEATDKASRTLSGIGGSLGKIGLIAGGAAVAGVAALGAGMVSLASSAEPIANIQAGFKGLADQTTVGAESMLKALQDSSQGFISNTDLMESFNKASQLVGVQFAEQLPDALGMVGKVAAATGQDMGFLMDSLVTGIGRLSPMILDNLGITVDLSSAYEVYAEKIGKSVSELTKQEQQAALTAQVIEKLGENTANLPDPTGGFQKFNIALTNLKDTIGTQLLPVFTPLLESLAAAAQRIIPILVEQFQRVQPILIQIGEAIAKLVAGDFDGFMKRLPGPIAEVVGKIVDLKNKVMALIKPIIDWVTQFVELKDILIAVGLVIGGAVVVAIGAFVVAAAKIALIVAGVIAVVTVLRKAWEENWLGIRDIVTTIVNAIKSVVEKTMGALQAFWAQHGDTILTIAQTVWNAIMVYIEYATAQIKTIVEIFQAAFEGDWTLFGEKLRELWDRAWNLILDIIKTVGPLILQAIATIITSIITKFRDTDWGAVGKSIIQGIANGIKNNVSMIISAAKSAAQAAFDAAKGFLGIDSPSKLFEGVGRNMAEGMALGMVNSQGLIRGAAMQMTTSSLSAGMAAQRVINNQQQYHYHLNVQSGRSAGRITDDFDLMRAMAR